MPTDPRTVRTYNAQAEAFAEHISDPNTSPLHEYYEKPAMQTELPGLKNLSVISLGCGNGVDARWIKDAGAKRVVGIDISEGMIDIASAKHKDIDFMVMDMEKLGFQDESFDIAYSSLALHYLDSWVSCLKEVRRVLQPNGKFIFSCNHPLETALEYFTDKQMRGARIGRSILQSTGERIIYGDYLAAESEGVRPILMTVADTPVHTYHRTIGKMIEEIIVSGLTIEKLVEPLPQAAMQTENAEHFKQVMKNPKFMIWVLKK